VGTLAARWWHGCRHIQRSRCRTRRGNGSDKHSAFKTKPRTRRPAADSSVRTNPTVSIDSLGRPRTRLDERRLRPLSRFALRLLGVQRLCDAETLRARCWHGPGYAHGTARDRLVCRTGGMRSSTSSVRNGATTACYRDGAVPKAFQRRAANVPEGGRTGGNQTSAPQLRPQALPDTTAASRGHDDGTVVAPDTFGPTAHKSVSSLRVLLYRCSARPSWTDL